MARVKNTMVFKDLKEKGLISLINEQINLLKFDFNYLKYKYEISRRSKLLINQVKLLAQDLPVIKTKELDYWTDFYGNGSILKLYTKMKLNYKLKLVIEHSILNTEKLWIPDIEARLPVLLCPGDFRQNVLKEVTDKKILKIGPLIAYSSGYLNEEEFKKEKQSLGKTLLVFHIHSACFTDVDFVKRKQFVEKINELGKNYDTIRICVYWIDYLKGYAQFFEDYGFECVTAGHILDPFFLPRLRSIIELSDLVVTNAMGTHLFYSVLFNKPYYVIPKMLDYDAMVEKSDNWKYWIEHESTQKLHKAFGVLRDDISKQQYDLANYYAGFDYIKTPEEMKNIFDEAEFLYQRDLKKKNYFTYSKRKALYYTWK